MKETEEEAAKAAKQAGKEEKAESGVHDSHSVTSRQGSIALKAC